MRRIVILISLLLISSPVFASDCADYYDVSLNFKSEPLYFEKYKDVVGKDHIPGAWQEFPMMEVRITQRCGPYDENLIAHEKFMVSAIRYSMPKEDGEMLRRVLRSFSEVTVPNDVSSFFEKPLTKDSKLKNK